MKKRLCAYAFAAFSLLNWAWAQEEGEAIPGINEFVYVEVEPEPVNYEEVIQMIGYPEQAIQENIQGDVVVRILIDEAGNYMKHSISKETHPVLTEAVEAHVAELAFTPALQNGKPIKFWKNIRFPFKLVEEQRDPREVAVEVLTELLAQDSLNYQAYLKRGIQYRDLNELDKAVDDFNAAIALNPMNPANQAAPVEEKKKKDKQGEEASLVDSSAIDYLFYAYYARGTALALQQNHQQAIADMDRSLTFADQIKEPDSTILLTIPNVYMERGFAYANVGRTEKALEDYYWVSENGPKTMACNVQQLIVDIYLAQNNYEELVNTYGRMIECQPSALTYYSRGYYRSLTGDYQGAIEDFTTMLSGSRIVNLNIAAQNRIGWAYWKMEQYDEALAAIQQAIDVNVLNPQSYYYRALIMESKGDREAACAEAQKAMNYGMEETNEEAEIRAFMQRIDCQVE